MNMFWAVHRVEGHSHQNGGLEGIRKMGCWNHGCAPRQPVRRRVVWVEKLLPASIVPATRLVTSQWCIMWLRDVHTGLLRFLAVYDRNQPNSCDWTRSPPPQRLAKLLRPRPVMIVWILCPTLCESVVVFLSFYSFYSSMVLWLDMASIYLSIECLWPNFGLISKLILLFALASLWADSLQQLNCNSFIM